MKSFKSVIGVDIGHSTVKCAQMIDAQGTMTLVKASCFHIEAESPEERKNAMAAAFKKAVADFELRSAGVVVTVDTPDVNVFNVLMPQMPAEELAEALKWEIKDRVPDLTDDTLLGFRVSGNVTLQDVTKQSVLVAVVKQRSIEELRSVCAVAGIKPFKIIPASIAQESLLKRSASDIKEACGVIDMGETLFKMNVFNDGQLVFSRKIPVAGEDLTNCLTAPLVSSEGKIQLTFEEAEKIKKQHGIPSGEEHAIIDGKISNTQVMSLMRPKIEQLVKEIERSLDYYREQYGARIGKLVLFGATAKLKGLTEYLNRELDMPVEIGDALEQVSIREGVEIEASPITHKLNLAVGAALDKNEGVNLLRAKSVRQERSTKKRLWTALIASELLIMFLAGGWAYWRAAVHEKELNAVRKEYHELFPQVQDLKQRLILDQTLKSRPLWKEVLKEISNIVPEQMYFTLLEMNNGLVTVKGVIEQSSQSAEEVLSAFMLRLEKGSLKNVQLVETRKDDVSQGSSFEIQFQVD